mmetsp:Transcript_13895/g.52069  ORF Transcript_13895/g.52069 Transcript_13895/m.52069 type:complete len:205 (+) Transcript_13895:594-1208(+)
MRPSSSTQVKQSAHAARARASSVASSSRPPSVDPAALASKVSSVFVANRVAAAAASKALASTSRPILSSVVATSADAPPHVGSASEPSPSPHVVSAELGDSPPSWVFTGCALSPLRPSCSAWTPWTTVFVSIAALGSGARAPVSSHAPPAGEPSCVATLGFSTAGKHDAPARPRGSPPPAVAVSWNDAIVARTVMTAVVFTTTI